MAMAERGSFMWLLVSITQIWLALKLMEDVEGWLTAIIGTSGAACIMVAIVLFRQEQRDLLLNPMKTIQKEVHPDQISKQGKGVWIGVAIWVVAMIFGSVAL
tara:strand:- start:96 stop:401 length:306 start_codon:yes stop_codon:yes gene_type:complete